jgi:hypothetical protein
MLSEEKVKRLYKDQMERCKGYYVVAAHDKSKEELYEAHIWALCRIGKILEIPEAETFAELKKQICDDRQ